MDLRMALRQWNRIMLNKKGEKTKTLPHCQDNSKIEYKNRRKIEKLIPYTNVHDHSIPWFGTNTLKKKVTGLN